MDYYKNTSDRTLAFPNGKTAKPGDVFSETQAAGLNLRALLIGGTIRKSAAPKKKTKGKKS